MQKFIVEGGVKLSGSITPSGNKNEALPVLAAALLANKPVIIHNVPEILDISTDDGDLEDIFLQVTNK